MSSDPPPPPTASACDATDPTLSFRVADGCATVVAVDERFRDRYGDPDDRRLSAVLAEILRRPDPAALAHEIAAGDDDDRYAVTGDGDGPDLLVRPTHDDPTSGRVRFVDLPSPPARTDDGENESTTEETATAETTTVDSLDGEAVASVLSHDLRNPLDVAKANLRVAREAGETERLAAVADAHDRMGTIIDGVLTLARPDGVDARRIDLVTIARRAWDAVATGNAQLRVAPSSLSARGDPAALERLFENLFRNAVEHAGAEPTVRVVETADGFAVEDDGPGVPPAARDRVFESGYSPGDGTGLGLAIVARIVAVHGWSVRVTDGTDGGARFEVDYPSLAAPTDT